MKKRIGLSIAVLLSLLVFLLFGWSESMALDCNDDATKEVVLTKLFVYPSFIGAKSKGKIKSDLSEEEFEKDLLAESKLSYSNGELSITEKAKPDGNEKMKFSLSNIKTTNIKNNNDRCECGADFTAEVIRDGKAEEIFPKQEISYTSELAADSKKHSVTVKMGDTFF